MKNDTVNLSEAYVSIYKENETPEVNGPEHTQELIAQLLDYLSRGCTFASFMYKSKGLGDTALYNVRLNVDYGRAKTEDYEKLKSYQPEDENERTAKDHLLNLYNNPKTKTQKQLDSFTNYGKGIRISNTTGELHIYGYRENKEVVATGITKADTRGELKKACDNLKKKLNFQHDKIRDFILEPDYIAGFKVRGDLIEFQQTDNGEHTGS